MSPTITPLVRPWRGFRGSDPWGTGNFGASRDGGGRTHDGIDCLALIGDVIVAPFPGIVTHLGTAYPLSTLGSIHLKGLAEFTGWEAKILYVEPDPGLGGRVVAAGDRLGVAQNVAGYWRTQQPDHVGDMKNHVHLEIRVTETRLVDPVFYFPSNLVVQRPESA